MVFLGVYKGTISLFESWHWERIKHLSHLSSVDFQTHQTVDKGLLYVRIKVNKCIISPEMRKLESHLLVICCNNEIIYLGNNTINLKVLRWKFERDLKMDDTVGNCWWIFPILNSGNQIQCVSWWEAVGCSVSQSSHQFTENKESQWNTKSRMLVTAETWL